MPNNQAASNPSEEETAARHTVAGGLHDASPPLSFSNIADLIVSGQTHLIPNNDIIPDKLSVRLLLRVSIQTPDLTMSLCSLLA